MDSCWRRAAGSGSISAASLPDESHSGLPGFAAGLFPCPSPDFAFRRREIALSLGPYLVLALPNGLAFRLRARSLSPDFGFQDGKLPCPWAEPCSRPRMSWHSGRGHASLGLLFCQSTDLPTEDWYISLTLSRISVPDFGESCGRTRDHLARPRNRTSSEIGSPRRLARRRSLPTGPRSQPTVLLPWMPVGSFGAEHSAERAVEPGSGQGEFLLPDGCYDHPSRLLAMKSWHR